MWTWTCTACGETFTRAEKPDAQAAFFDHVTTAHPKAVVLSMDATR